MPGVGSVWFNSNYGSSSGTNNLVSPVVGNHGFLTYTHEIGHAPGLDHMGDYNGSQNNGPSCYEDSTVYSIMSYYGPNWGSSSSAGAGQVAWADWIGADGKLYSPQTPMLNDILAIQNIYGADTTTRAGNTVYGYSSNISGAVAAIFDFAKNAHPILTIYDANGTDTLNLSGYATDSVINLGSGSFTSCNAMTNNIAIAYNCTIENATGGAGNDTINGNSVNNVLIGGSGNDTINGAGGNDTLTGGLGDDVLKGDTGNDSINGGTGVDTLTGGDGNDTFVFTTKADAGTIASHDVVTDFISGVDKIDLSVIDASTTLSGNQAFSFIGVTDFVKAGELRYDVVQGLLLGDLNGDHIADFAIGFTGVSAFVVSDFVL
jgi:serralysin